MTHEYHDALDRYEARVRAEQAERELNDEEGKPLCICLEYIGDNGVCLVHDPDTEEPEGIDNRMSTQIREHIDS